jgi:uncharacterized membrane protein required for colicin V production
MNVIDIIVVVIILLLCIRGVFKGLVYSIFDFFSYIIAAYLAIKYNSPLTKILSKTPLYDKINISLNEFLSKNFNSISVESIENLDINVFKTSLDTYNLPEETKDMIVESIDINSIFNTGDIVNSIALGLTNLFITVISILIIFFIVKVILGIVAFTINGVMKLPILNSINKIFGGIFGLLTGIMIILAVFALLSIFNLTQTFTTLSQQLDNSIIARIFYDHNILLNYIYKYIS